MPVCIAGMHRSGTSLVTQLIHRCGLNLGPADQLMQPAPDNPEGFWECIPFVSLNQDLMEARGGGWNAPPEMPVGWEHHDSLIPWQQRARQLPVDLGMIEPWGWKDPRNSITLPFWRSVWPDLRVVVCVRHPLEVACSLLDRDGFPLMQSLRLWLNYYQRILDAVPADRRIVTHYETYFNNPAAELSRLCKYLDLPATADVVQSACVAVTQALRHSEFGVDSLTQCGVPVEIVALYDRLRSEAGLAVPVEPPRRTATLVVTRETIRLDLLAQKQQERLQELETQVLSLAAELDRTMHQFNLAREFGEARDKRARFLEQRLGSARHRYADKFAGVLLKITDPMGRKRVERTVDELLSESNS